MTVPELKQWSETIRTAFKLLQFLWEMDWCADNVDLFQKFVPIVQDPAFLRGGD